MKMRDPKIFTLSLLLASAAAQAGDGPVATVRTALVVEQTLRHTLSAFGEVRADAQAERSLGAASAGQVVRVSVRAGQRVPRGAVLLELATDPAAQLGYEQARDQLRFAQADLARTRELLAGGLATRAQVAVAEKAIADAGSALAAQQHLGTRKARTVLRAPFAGVVSKLDVHAGDRVAAGTTLLNLAASEHRVAVLGVEPEDAMSLPEHAAVALTPVFGEAEPVMLQLDGVNGLVNPDTRFVEALVRLSAATPLLPGTRVHGLITLDEQTSLAVPRIAVLNDGKDYLFVVRENKARRIEVRRGVEWQGQLGVGGALAAGDKVVTEGQAVLTEGMTVKDAPP